MKFQRFRLDAGSLGGLIKVLRPLPSETREGDTLVVDPWGALASLRLVPEFATLIPVVDGESFSHALHGWFRPLMGQIGPEPKHQLIRIPPLYSQCSLMSACVMYDSKRCHPRSRQLPECWTPNGPDAEVRHAMGVATLAWAEGFYVVIVDGEEFVIGA